MNRLFLLSLLATPAVFAQTPEALPKTTKYTVINKCPQTIDLYIAGKDVAKVATGHNYTTSLGPNPGFFYTDANGGNKNGSATRAGFFTDSAYYYLVKDVDHFNTGVKIVANGYKAPTGFCDAVECDTADCAGAYSTPPTRFPAPVKIPPTDPLHECPPTSPLHPVTYEITFCPTGKFPTKPIPPAKGVPIHPVANAKKCLDVKAAKFANGTPVQIYDCNGTPAQNWVVVEGSTAVKLAGTDYCLDAGSKPANGVGMKIWQCYDNLPAQEWVYTKATGRIALGSAGQCLDLYKDILTNGNKVQTWQCSTGNKNQQWIVGAAAPPPPPPPPSKVHQVHPNGNTKKCLDVKAAKYANGTPVQIYDCNKTGAQNFELVKGATSIKVNGTNFCLDAGSDPKNGVAMKIWQCYDNLPAQEWVYTDSNTITLGKTGYCLDLTKGSVTNGNPAQIWKCSTGNKNQIWTL